MQRLDQQQRYFSQSQTTASAANMSDSNGLTKVFTKNACPRESPLLASPPPLCRAIFLAIPLYGLKNIDLHENVMHEYLT